MSDRIGIRKKPVVFSLRWPMLIPGPAGRCLRSAILNVLASVGPGMTGGFPRESGGGPPHSGTLRAVRGLRVGGERLGVRQSSGAFRGQTSGHGRMDGRMIGPGLFATDVDRRPFIKILAAVERPVVSRIRFFPRSTRGGRRPAVDPQTRWNTPRAGNWDPA